MAKETGGEICWRRGQGLATQGLQAELQSSDREAGEVLSRRGQHPVCILKRSQAARGWGGGEGWWERGRRGTREPGKEAAAGIWVGASRQWLDQAGGIGRGEAWMHPREHLSPGAHLPESLADLFGSTYPSLKPSFLPEEVVC